jgi:flagellar motility protein MotE (MotC chaperone)
VGKIAATGAYVYCGLERFPWPAPAEAASEDKASSPGDRCSDGKTAALVPLLKKKQAQLREKEEQLREKEAELVLLREEVSRKLADLVALQEQVNTGLKELTERETASHNSRIKLLAEVYKAMEPAKAATLLEKLDEDIAVHIVAGMRGRAAGQILSRMEPNRAALISKRLSQSCR